LISETEAAAEPQGKPERQFFKNQPVIDGFKVFDPYMNKKKDGFAFSSRSRSAVSVFFLFMTLIIN
jgi:hypothetical protein